MITIDEFVKIDLRVGRVLSVERIEGSEKLLKLEVDLGEEGKRQILAGIGKSYAVEDVVGKQVIVVANLESRNMMGYESEGMVLAAGENPSDLAFLMPERDVIPGARIK